MSVAIITGSAGLIGSEAARHFAAQGLDVVGIDNDMRRVFFGGEASTHWNRRRLERDLNGGYAHHDLDIRDRDGLHRIFARFRDRILVVVHAAAQPSHDWAATDPCTDFEVNALGTHNLLEATRRFAPSAPFIFTSTNKVYGDTPNQLPLIELETRFEIEPDHPCAGGIREDMSIDRSLHSLFGASKVAADVLVQEYGRYFGIPTVCFRGGTLTGPSHSATELHGFLAYIMRCALAGRRYTIYGYKGKQVRDAIHSADLISAFDEFVHAPRVGEVYNIGGGRSSNVSVLEALELAARVAGKPVETAYVDENRVGDHVWWIGDNSRFESHFPTWRLTYDVPRILEEIYTQNVERWSQQPAPTMERAR